MVYALAGKRVWVAGHRGMVGQAMCRQLQSRQAALLVAPRQTLDLRRQDDVMRWIDANRPDAIVLAAATVGGIDANRTRPAEFIYDNLMIAANVVEAAHRCGVGRLLYLGSSCIYPRDAAQPMAEDALLTGPLEPTNRAYALAKIAGLELCRAYRVQYGRDYIAAMPCNLYGPGDRFDPVQSHVIPALVMKICAARDAGADAVTLWGTGGPLREFLHVDDLAVGLCVLLESYSGAEPVNIGSGEEISIAALARMIAALAGYYGEIRFDPAMPDGTPRKILDSARMRGLGWMPRVAFGDGLAAVIRDYDAAAQGCVDAA